MYGDKGTAQHRRKTSVSGKEARQLDDPYHPFPKRRTTPRRQDRGMEGLKEPHASSSLMMSCIDEDIPSHTYDALT